jgi:hypothetical protein
MRTQWKAPRAAARASFRDPRRLSGAPEHLVEVFLGEARLYAWLVRSAELQIPPAISYERGVSTESRSRRSSISFWWASVSPKSVAELAGQLQRTLSGLSGEPELGAVPADRTLGSPSRSWTAQRYNWRKEGTSERGRPEIFILGLQLGPATKRPIRYIMSTATTDGG